MELKSNRYSLIDSLRGVAAVWVMLYHFYNALLPEKDYQLYWAPIDAFFQAGTLGVYIFFVLSGFVINLNLHSKEMTGSFFLRFLLRRSVRLDIPYWVVILMTGLSIVLMANFGLSRREDFTFYDYLMNMLYLDNLVGAESIMAVGWTLQYEIQFYLFFALILFALSKFQIRGPWVNYILLFTFLISILYWFEWFPFYRKSLFLDLWFCFLLGSFVSDVINNRMSIWLYALAVLMAIIHVIIFQNPATTTAIVTSLFILVAARFNGLNSWLSWRPMLFLGSISYSLYLLHPFFGNRLIRFINYRYDITVGWSLLILAGTIALTILLVWVFYKLVELPSHRLSKKIKL